MTIRLSHPGRRIEGFTLVELLVVIGIITILIGMMMPMVTRAYEQANSVKCKSQLMEIGRALEIYSNNWNGWMFPPNLGWDPPGTRGAIPQEDRWPAHVFYPPVWNPPILICPADLEPAGEHSYILNNHLADYKIKFTTHLANRSPSELILMGEKVTSEPDYYMELSDFNRLVELRRHNLRIGSNYLYMDLHVDSFPPTDTVGTMDPWDPYPSTQPSSKTPGSGTP